MLGDCADELGYVGAEENFHSPIHLRITSVASSSNMGQSVEDV